MDLHLRQQFDVTLAMAVDRFAERLEQHNEGTEPALQRLRENPEAPTVRLGEFVDAIFRDALLDSPDGALFVLGALAKRPQPPAVAADARTVGEQLQRLAHAVFAELLRDRTEEELSRRLDYGAHLMANHS